MGKKFLFNSRFCHCPLVISCVIYLTVFVIGVHTEEPLSVLLANDSCATYDSCNVSDFFRTCSCLEDCSFYGTCCSDSPNFDGTNSGDKNFHCYGEKLTQPVFFKKSCLPGYRGDKEIKSSCEESGTKLSDLYRTIPVSSNKTMITYWNWNCAICNDERKSDLSLWTVQVSCPIGKAHKRYDVEVYRRNIMYQEGSDSWGIYVDSKFRECPINFFQPPYLTGKLRYCAPNIVSECPESWKDEEVREKCHSLHGERKRKSTNVYYKNVYCAICNGIQIKDLECFGRTYKTYSPPGDINTMKMIFNLNPLKGEHSKYDLACFRGKRYDPFMKLCRSVDCGIANSKDEGKDFCQYSSASSTVPLQSLYIAIAVIITSLFSTV